MVQQVLKLMDDMVRGEYDWRQCGVDLTAREVSILLMAAVTAGMKGENVEAAKAFAGFEHEFIGLAYKLRTRLEDFRRDIER